MFDGFDVMATLRNSPIFMVLVAGSIVTLSAAIERALYFRKRNGDAVATLAKAIRKVRSGDRQDAYRACESTSHPLGVAGMQVLDNPIPGGQTLEERLQVCLSQQRMLLERNVSVLGTMAAVAPLVGLLGTIWGIMRAFHNMAITGSSAPAVVAAGVAEALLTTAAGIVIAVPAILAYNHFTRRMNVMLTEAENGAHSLSATLLEIEYRDRQALAAAASGGETDGRLPSALTAAAEEALSERAPASSPSARSSELMVGR